MDGGQLPHTCLLETLEGTEPEVQVGRNGIFDEHGHIHTFQGIGQLLNRKRIDDRAGTDPQCIDIVFQSQFDMFWSCNFGYCGQARFSLCFTKPLQAFLSPALEGIRTGAGLPDAATQHGHLRDFGQGLGCGEDLFFAFHAAGAG